MFYFSSISAEHTFLWLTLTRVKISFWHQIEILVLNQRFCEIMRINQLYWKGNYLVREPPHLSNIHIELRFILNSFICNSFLLVARKNRCRTDGNTKKSGGSTVLRFISEKHLMNINKLDTTNFWLTQQMNHILY